MVWVVPLPSSSTRTSQGTVAGTVTTGGSLGSTALVSVVGGVVRVESATAGRSTRPPSASVKR